MTAQQEKAEGKHLVYYRVQNVENAGISEVIPGLFISGICALRPSIMKEYGINLIVNATSEVPNSASLGKMPRMKLWLEDDPDVWILSYLDYVCSKIRKLLAKGGNVLIHSVQGVSRCATICLAYLTKYKFKTLRDAYLYLACVRPKVEPTIGFWRQLIAFEQDQKQEMGSVQLVRFPEGSLVPDVYLTLAAQRRKLQQLQEQATTSSATGASGQPSVDGTDQNNNNDNSRLAAAVSATATAPLMASIISGVAEVASNDVGKAATKELLAGRPWSQKSHMPRRKNSLSKKFLPVLEPLTEVVDATA